MYSLCSFSHHSLNDQLYDDISHLNKIDNDDDDEKDLLVAHISAIQRKIAVSVHIAENLANCFCSHKRFVSF